MFFISTISYPVFANDLLSEFVPNAKPVGEGRLSVFIWDVYDATLYAPNGDWNTERPFALELSYLMNLEGKKIADRSIEEIRNQGFDDEIKLADWHSQMRSIFPDVGEGVKLIGVYTKEGESVFFKNNETIGRVTDPEFGKAFFDIWLSEKTSEPGLRKKLLGGL